MTPALLTIAIPTYQRASHLDYLLSVLTIELKGLEERVRILVSDNASPDHTPEVIAKYRAGMPSLIYQRNTENLGPDRNICACFMQPDTPYVWIIGDDDAPLPGAIGQLLAMLEETRPDMVYLPSLPTHDLAQDYPKQSASHPRWISYTQAQFASVIHVQLTFISGLVFRKNAATPASIAAGLRHAEETHLIQLGWTLEILKQGQRFFIARHNMLMATAGNSGGYSVLQVFLVNLTRLINELLGDRPDIARRILKRTSANYLPGLIWNIKTHRMGRFDLPPRSAIQVPPELSRLASFRWMVEPIWRWPKALAWPLFQLSRLIARSTRWLDQLASRR